jgi:hypothetical protein
MPDISIDMTRHTACRIGGQVRARLGIARLSRQFSAIRAYFEKIKHNDNRPYAPSGDTASRAAATSVPEKKAERRAWATVNKHDGGGQEPGGSGRKDAERQH